MKHSIIFNLQDVYENDPWYGQPVKNILKEVDPSHAFLEPASNVHSIAALVAHMIAWREFVLHRLSGNNDVDVNQEESFNWKLFGDAAPTTWHTMLEALHQNQEKLVKAMRKMQDSMLREQVPGRSYSFGYLCEGIIQHDVYHLGQIALLLKWCAARSANQ